MAIVAPDELLNPQNQTGGNAAPTGTVVGTQTAVQPSGIGGTSTTQPQATQQTGGGGLAGGKSPTPTGVTQGGTPEQSASAAPTAANSSGNFTNLQSYLNENPNAASSIAGNISNAVNQQNTQATNAINTGVNQFNTDVAGGTTNLNQNLISSALADPTAFTSGSNAAANEAAFNAQIHPTYTGPTSLQNDSAVYNPINQAVTNAQNYGGQVGTAGGREALLSTLAPQGSNLSQGALGLNNFFLQSSPEAMQTITAPTVNLTAQLNTAQNNALGTAAQGAATTAATGANVLGQVNAAQGGIQNAVNQNVSSLQSQAQANQAAIQNALSTNSPLTPAQIQSMGITQAQWTALQNLATQYSADIGTQNNLMTLGAQQLMGMSGGNALIPTTGSQVQNGGLLSNILNVGGNTIAAAQAGSTAMSALNGLASGLSGAGAGAAAAGAGANLAASAGADATTAATNAANTSAFLTGDAAANTANAAAQAGTDAASAASDLAAGASMAAEALPLIGGAITVGQIFANGQFGNGQGGVSGGMSGAMQGASMGAAIGSIIPGVGTVIGGIVGGIAGFLGGMFSGGQQSNFQVTTLGVDPSGMLTLGASSGDRTDPAPSRAAATQAVQLINQLMQANGLMLNGTGPALPGNSPLGIYGGTHGSIGNGMPLNAAGLWAWMVDNNMIVPNPNSTAHVNNPLNFSSYVTAAQPSVAITAANTATAKQYSDYNALNILSGQNNGFLQQANAAQAGTAQPTITSFNYQSALDNLNQDINTYNTMAPAQKAAALALLQQGLSSGEGH
jgi:hypothetical protein